MCNPTRLTVVSTLLAGSLFYLSCTDDIDNISSGDSIRFVSDVQNSTGLQSEGHAAVRSTVSSLQTDGMGVLYLHTIYADSIAPREGHPDDTVSVTRAMPVNQANMYTSFGVSAFAYTGEWDGSQTPNYMYNVSVSQSGGLWQPSSTYFWPGQNYKMRFFALAPKDNDAYRLSGVSAGYPTISCTVPNNVSDQLDLLVAASDEVGGDYGKVLPLSFRHALTAVRFVCGADMKSGTVRSITLKNIYGAGTYDMGNARWTTTGTRKDFGQTLEKAASGTEGEAITLPAQTFMMIPQTLADGATLEVVFADTEGEHRLTGNIAGNQWEMGKTVTYKISTSSVNWEYTLNVTGTGDFSRQGGTQPYSITSYRTNGKGEQQPVAWTAEFSTDGGTQWQAVRPDWLTAFTAGGAGSETATAFNATVSASEGRTFNPSKGILQARTAKGTEGSPYNLSNASGAATVQNTANCYVVDGPGWYSFPLVYGNAIKNGTKNEPAYISSVGDTEYALHNLVNHRAEPVTDPYINNNANCTAAHAELLWQDAPRLVDNISLEGAGQAATVRFHVDKNSICQGNAVIAVKNAEGTILWSWHIWVTDADLSRTITSVSKNFGKTYSYMPVVVGYCDGDSTVYAKRSCLVRITAGEASQTFRLTQVGDTITQHNAPYFQYGRKDPFLPYIYVKGQKEWYDNTGTGHTIFPKTQYFPNNGDAAFWQQARRQKTLRSTSTQLIADLIQSPDIAEKDMFVTGSLANLWGWQYGSAPSESVFLNTDIPYVKTIYDPCPFGFLVPNVDAFTAFLNLRADAFGKYTGKQVNGSLLKDGAIVYEKSNQTGNKLFIPYLGYHVFYVKEDSIFAPGTCTAFWTDAPTSWVKVSAGIFISTNDDDGSFNYRFSHRSQSDGRSILGIKDEQ